MHVPPLLPSHRLSDWPDCTVELRCGCGRSSMPGTRLLAKRHGDQPVVALVQRMRCKDCGAKPDKVWLVAEHHRSPQGGPSPDWAVEIRP